jgi:hypothetical protein
MPNHKISTKCEFNDHGTIITFDSLLERQVYKCLRNFYKKDEIKCHVKYLLTDYPTKKSYVLDFETDDFYLEVKGSWICESKHSWNAFKDKTYWFMSQYRNKPFLVCMNQLPKYKSFNLKGVSLTNLANLDNHLEQFKTSCFTPLKKK